MKIITISGASGSGKSTLAEHVHKSLPDSLLLSLDRYYLSKAEQIEKNGYANFDYPSAIDVKLLIEHIADLKRDGAANVPIYDFTVSERAGYEKVTVTEAIIIDGLFSGALLAGISDLNVFIDVDLDLALLRRIERDMSERGRTLKSVTKQYMNDVRPAYFEHVENIKSSADMVLTNNSSLEQLITDSDKILELMSNI